MPKADSTRLEAKIQRLSIYSGIPQQVLEQRLLTLKVDPEEFIDQQLYCYTATNYTVKRQRHSYRRLKHSPIPGVAERAAGKSRYIKAVKRSRLMFERQSLAKHNAFI